MRKPLTLLALLITLLFTGCSEESEPTGPQTIVYNQMAFEVSGNDATLIGYERDNNQYSNPLKTLTIPSTFDKRVNGVNVTYTVKHIGDNALASEYNLENVTFPSTLRTIGNGAFKNCLKLKDVHFPEGLETIGYSAFESCTHITEIIIPSSVTTLGERAFATNSSLKNITIGEKVSYIGDEAFKDVFPTKITFKGKNPPDIVGNYLLTDGWCTFYVPQESLDIYKQILSKFMHAHDQIIGF